MRLGFYGDASTLLAQPAQANVLIGYYRGYCRQQLGTSPQADFEAASHVPLMYVFPNRRSSFAVLRAAIQANANDASAHYLIGLLYLSKRQVDNAIKEWEAARALNEKLPALDRNLGRAYLDLKADPAKALKILSAGRNREPSNSDLQDTYNRASSASQAYSECHSKISGPPSASVEAGPSLVTVSFTASPNCTWTAPPYLGWITANTPASGKGNGSVIYAIAANPGPASRTTDLTIAGKAFTITQAAAAQKQLRRALTLRFAPRPNDELRTNNYERPQPVVRVF